MNQASSISRLALLQCFVVVAGVLMTGGILKLNGYDPGSAARWNPVAVAVRNLGFLPLVVPAIWTGGCVVLERRARNDWTRTWSIVSGVLVIAVLSGLLWWTAATPFFFHKVPLQVW
jgi:hypothetical protein